jgi:hypothetical protein
MDLTYAIDMDTNLGAQQFVPLVDLLDHPLRVRTMAGLAEGMGESSIRGEVLLDRP